MTGEISASISTFSHSSSSVTSFGADGSLSSTVASSLTFTHDSFQGSPPVQPQRPSPTRNQGQCDPIMRGLFGGGCLGGAGLGFGLMVGINPIALLIIGLLLGMMLGLMFGGHGAQPCHEEGSHGAAQGHEGEGASLEIAQSILRVQGRIVPPPPATGEEEDISDANTPPAVAVEESLIPQLHMTIPRPEIPTHTINPYSESTEARSIFPPYTGRLQPPSNNITHVIFTPDEGEEQTREIPTDGLVVGNIRILRDGTFSYEGGAPTLTNNRITLLNGANNPVLRVNIQDQ